MSKLQDRKNIVATINAAACLYKSNLVGKKFMYVFDHRYIEVIFKASNFRHLTGVATDLSALRFYEYASKKKLAANQIRFDSIHPYDLCARKIKHLAQISTLAGSESFILEEIVTTTKTFKFGTTDLCFTLCLGKEYDAAGQPRGDCFVAESLRDEDCFSKSKSAFVVSHIFMKKNDQKLYGQMLFMDKDFEVEDVPDSVKSLLSKDLLQ